MAIACMACGGPVHESAVKCPHCGDRTGAVPTKPTAAEAAAIARIEEVRFYNAIEKASGRPRTSALPVGGVLGPFGAASLVAEVLAATARTLDEPLPPPEAAPAPAPPRPPAAAVPPAIARERPPRPPTVEPLPSKAPEPAPPPADQPRFLK